MMRVEPAGQRAEGGHDELGRRHHEAAARDVAAPEVQRSLGWKWPEISGRGSSRTASWRSTIPPTSTSSSIRPPQWSAKPGSWLPTIQVQSSFAVSSVSSARALGRQAVAAEAVVEAVAEAIEARRAGRVRPSRRARSASRANHRAEGTARAARTSSLFRGAGRRPAAPPRAARTARRQRSRKRFACERKGNHARRSAC